jgi:hypothetical protein
MRRLLSRHSFVLRSAENEELITLKCGYRDHIQGVNITVQMYDFPDRGGMFIMMSFFLTL